MKQSIFHSHLNISGTRGGATQKSSDLDMGRRPKLESGEFCDAPPFVLEVLRCEDSTFFDFASLYRSFTPWPSSSFRSCGTNDKRARQREVSACGTRRPSQPSPTPPRTVSRQCVEFTGMGLFEKNQKWSLTTSCGQLTTFGRLKKSGIEYVILEGSSLFAWLGSGQG